MNITYDEKELARFFETVEIVNPEIDRVRYKTAFAGGLILTLYLSPFDMFGSVMLKRQNEEGWLLDIGIEDLTKIIRVDNLLFFYRDDKKKSILKLQIEPQIFVSCEAGTSRRERGAIWL